MQHAGGFSVRIQSGATFHRKSSFCLISIIRLDSDHQLKLNDSTCGLSASSSPRSESTEFQLQNLGLIQTTNQSGSSARSPSRWESCQLFVPGQCRVGFDSRASVANNIGVKWPQIGPGTPGVSKPTWGHLTQKDLAVFQALVSSGPKSAQGLQESLSRFGAT